MNLKRCLLISLACLLLALPSPVFAQPPLPEVFYGKLTIGGEPAPVGTVVEAEGTNVITDVPGNPIVTTVAGEYGTVSEPKLVVQGPNIKNGDIIEFYINGAKANQTYLFQGGGRHTRLDLTIASAPPPPPANFVVTNLLVFPVEVEPGETVTIEAEVTNSGGSTGDYTATLKINGTIVDSISITLDPGEDETVSFSIAKEATGTYLVQLAGLEGTFTVTEPAELPPSGTPAAFTLSLLSISPIEANIGESVTISVLVANTGEGAGSYTITLKINGVEEATEEITLAGGASDTVIFTTVQDEAGTYSVDVDGLRDSFMVKKSPASTMSPPVAPPSAPPSRVNWAILGPIIGVAVFLAIFLPIRQRRRRVG